MKSNKRQTGFSTLEALIVVLVVVVIGAAAYFVSQRNSSSVANTATAADHLPSTLDGLKPFKQVQAKALDKAGDTDIVSANLEEHDGKPTYMFKLANGRILLYDAKSGGLVTDKKTTVGKEGQVLPDQFIPSITMDEAMATAKAQLPDKDVTRITLQNEQRVVVYSVFFTKGGRVDVNAKTGELVKVLKGANSGSSHKPAQKTDDSDGTTDGTNSSNPGHGKPGPVNGTPVH